MNLFRKLHRAVLVTCVELVLVAPPSFAGQECRDVAPSPAALYRGLELGRKTFDALDATGASVALVALAGQDLSRYRLRWSHMGFVVRDHAEGQWTVVHELNRCGTPDSTLYTQGLGNFFLDDPFEYRALVVVPSADVQRRLLAVLQGPLPSRMHDPHYNVVAYPFSTEYQNSNQWVLELMATALAGDTLPFAIDDRAAVQSWLRGEGFRPATLEIPAVERLGARMFRANVAFDDQPFERRMAGRIAAVSVESVVDFLRARGVVQEVRVVTMSAPPGRRIPMDR